MNVPGSWTPAETLAFLPGQVAEMHVLGGWAVASGKGKQRSDPSSGGASVPVSGPGKHFHAKVPKGKCTNTEAMNLVSAAADRSQTKLLSSSHLTTDYTRLILSSQFERTIITPWLILPLNILCSDWQAVAVGGSRHAWCENKAAEEQGWMPCPRGWTVAPGRPGGLSLLTCFAHLSRSQQLQSPVLGKLKSRPQCCWCPKSIQSCALKVVPWHGRPTFLPKIYPAVHCASLSTHRGEYNQPFQGKEKTTIYPFRGERSA